MWCVCVQGRRGSSVAVSMREAAQTCLFQGVTGSCDAASHGRGGGHFCHQREAAIACFSKVSQEVVMSFPWQALHLLSMCFRCRRGTEVTVSDRDATLYYTSHFTFYTPHFILHTLHSTLYTLHFALYTAHSTLYPLHFTLHLLLSALHTQHTTLHTPYFTLYTPHFTLYTLHSTLDTLHSTLGILHFTLYTLHCTLCT